MGSLPSHRLPLASPALLAVLAAALLAACVPIPIPTRETAPRFSQEQIATIGGDAVTRSAVAASLGSPDIRREDDRVWIYLWTVTSGAWIAIPLAPPFAGYMGPITSNTFALVLTFDAGGGTLMSREFAREVTGTGKDAYYCTDLGLCLEYRVKTDVDHRVPTRILETGGPVERRDFHDQFSAVTVKNSMRDRLGVAEPRSDQCLVVIWPDPQAWMRSSWLHGVAGGLIVSVGGERNSWLPVGTYAEVALPRGVQAVEAVSPAFAGVVLQPQYWPKGGLPKSSATFECRAGERVYLTIGASGPPGNEFPIVLKTVDPATATPLISNMPKVLLWRRPAAPQ